MATASDISERIIGAVMAQKLPPRSRLGEQQLAMLFDYSRTMVREALTRLAAREQAAVKGKDVGMRSLLLGDFHVCLAECLANSLLAETLRHFTARTTLIAMRYQPPDDAAQSCAGHVEIVEALDKGDLAHAEKLMAAHLGTGKSLLQLPSEADPPAQLRDAHTPLGGKARELHTSGASPRRKPRPTRSTDLGDVP